MFLRIRFSSLIGKWGVHLMNKGVTLEKVQELKQKAVEALMVQNVGFDVIKEIDEFFTTNRYQILDILDDALYAHKKGKI